MGSAGNRRRALRTSGVNKPATSMTAAAAVGAPRPPRLGGAQSANQDRPDRSLQRIPLDRAPGLWALACASATPVLDRGRHFDS